MSPITESRAATLIEAGLRDGLGYRDTAQDILGALYSVGAEAKTRIFELLRGRNAGAVPCIRCSR